MHLYQVLKRPIVTEKSTFLQERNKNAYEIAQKATKRQVKDAVELAFKVNVTQVNVIAMRGKQKKVGRRTVMTPSWKKAVVTLTPGQKIQFFEGV
jgi:large subunit ribosomal protein L23